MVSRFPWMAMAYAVALLAGLTFVWFSVQNADHRMRSDALHQVRLFARSLSIADVKTLSGSPLEAGSPVYRRLKEQLAALRATDPHCRSLYLLSSRPDGEVVYLADSELIGGRNESPIGRNYAATPSFLRAFDAKTEMTKGPVRDAGGSWMSSLVLVPASDPGAEAIILGMDADASEWWLEMRSAGTVPLLLCFLLLAVLAGGRLVLMRSGDGGGHWIRHGEAALVALVGGILTMAAVWIAHDRTWRSYCEAFSQLADAEFANVTGVFQTLCNQELEGLARYFEGSEEVKPDEFRVYSEYLIRNPAVEAWEWIPVVPSNEVERFEAVMRNAGNKDFSVWQKDPLGKPVAVVGRPLYFPISYVEPLAGNERAVGYDPGSSPLLSTVLDSAAQSQLPRITPPIRLVQEVGSQKGAVVYMPVFTMKEPRQLRGYVAAVLRLGSFLRRVMAGQNPDHPYMTVDLLYLEGGEPQQLLASTSLKPGESSYSETRYLSIFGRTFAFRMQPAPAFSALYPLHAAWLVAAAGVVLTAVVTVLVGLTVRQRRNLEMVVEQRTRSLRDSEETFRRLFRNNPVSMSLANVEDGKFVDVNETFLSTLGYAHDDVIGRTPEELELFPDQDQFAGMAGELASKGSVAPVEIRVRHRNGTLLHGLFSGEIIRMADTLHTLSVMVDITPLKQGETERLRLVTAIEQASEIIVITDTRGIIQYANPAFTAITGYAGGEALGRTSSFLKSGTQDEAFYKDMWATIQSGRTWNGRFVNRRKDGTLYTEEATISPVRDLTGAVINYVAVKRDITKELKLEKQYLQAQKMELVGRLAGGVAHDFNNMLGVILGYTEMALAKVPPDQPLFEDLKAVQESAWKTADLTRQLLAYARKQTVLPKTLNLNQTVESALRMLGRLIGENIRIEWTPKADLWPVRMDPTQVDQILTNLSVNARDAINGVGTIVIKTDNVTLDNEYCSDHEGAYPGDYVMLAFGDNGCGMGPDVLAHIFEPFYTTKGVGEGSGLGLSTVYGIVKQNHGFISAESKLGQGATFKVYLPRQSGHVAAPSLREPPVPAEGGNETVLLVEDDAAVLAMTKQLLMTLGYTVLATGNTAEAIRLVRERCGHIHVLLVDVVMPEMSGTELARQLTMFCPGLRTVFISSYPPGVVASHGVPKNSMFIQKPFSLSALASTLRKSLQN